jgi:hypothetical protein
VLSFICAESKTAPAFYVDGVAPLQRIEAFLWDSVYHHKTYYKVKEERLKGKDNIFKICVDLPRSEPPICGVFLYLLLQYELSCAE